MAAYYLVILMSGIRAVSVDHVPMASLESCQAAARTVAQDNAKWTEDLRTLCVASGANHD